MGEDDINSELDIPLDNLNDAVITRDNGLLISGEYDSKITVIKTDPNFLTYWRRDDFEWGNLMRGDWGSMSYWISILNSYQTDEGNYCLTGMITEGGCVISHSILVIGLDKRGSELINTRFDQLYVVDAIKTDDGGQLLYGTKLIKLNRFIDVTWEKDYDPWTIKVINTRDGNYAMVFRRDGKESLLRVLDRNGNEILSAGFCFNELFWDEVAYDLVQLSDNGFFIVGRSENYEGSSPHLDCAVIRLRPDGTEVWKTRFGSDDNDEWLDNILYTNDQYAIIQGSIGFPNASYRRSTVFKIDYNGQVLDSCSFNPGTYLLYNQKGYFIKAEKTTEGLYHFNKIPLDAIFDHWLKLKGQQSIY